MQAKPRRLTKRTTAIIAVAIVAIVIASGGGTYYYVNYVAQRPITCTLPSGRDAIKVGFTISLTGTFNVEGAKSLAGIQAAACWINNNGGYSGPQTVNEIFADFVIAFVGQTSYAGQLVGEIYSSSWDA